MAAEKGIYMQEQAETRKREVDGGQRRGGWEDQESWGKVIPSGSTERREGGREWKGRGATGARPGAVEILPGQLGSVEWEEDPEFLEQWRGSGPERRTLTS